MRSNKDVAIRAKVIAEQKLMEKDYAGAKEFALRAQALYPGLYGLPQMFATLEVYISGEIKINGEVDWYSVLGASPSADEETLRKQYHKLALMLHPDKNKSIGAEGAFKLLSEAWSVLSDKPKRQAFNQRRGAKGLQQKVPTNRGFSSAAPSSNGHQKFPNVANGHQKFPDSARANPTVPPPQQRSDTFWTICHRCKFHYEYFRIYLDLFLLCPKCREGFLASETPAPKHSSSTSQTQPKYQNTGAAQNSEPEGSVPFSDTNGHRPPFSSTVGVESKIANAPVAADIVQRASEKLKRQREEVQAASGWEKLLRKKEAFGDDLDGSGVKTASQVPTGHVGKEKEKISIESDPSELKGNGVSSSFKDVYNAKKPLDSTSANDAKKENIESGSINVPDPDFHDFDSDRTESSFEDNQVWAAYDHDGGMPRSYAMIHKVISSSPFKMQISWLNSKANSAFGPVEWLSCGFVKSCGILRIGKHLVNRSLSSFSHKVNWTKGPRGTVCVLPRKGDVWALYRNWSLDWDKLTPDEVIQKYDMVEVLEDYTEDQGVSVAPLVKVPGFRTVFRADTDPGKVRRIEKKEMSRFSHQVPNYILTGLEAQKVPKGCQELDPAATPLELLQVITEADDATKEERGEETGEEKLLNIRPPAAVDEMVADTPQAEVVEESEESRGGEATGTRK